MEETAVITLPQNIKLHTLMMVGLKYMKRPEDDNREIDDQNMHALRASIRENKEWLYARPIVVNTFLGREGVVIAGDKRRQAAVLEGWEKIPTMFFSVPQAKEKVYNIIDNNHNGHWIENLLRNDLHDLNQDGINMESLSFTPDVLVSAMHGLGDAQINPKDDPEYKGSTPSKKKCEHNVSELIQKIGDIYHTLENQYTSEGLLPFRNMVVEVIDQHFTDKTKPTP